MPLIAGFLLCMAIIAAGTGLFLIPIERSRELQQALYGQRRRRSLAIDKGQLVKWIVDGVQWLASKRKAKPAEDEDDELAQLVREAGYPWGWGVREFELVRQIAMAGGAVLAVLGVVLGQMRLVIVGGVLVLAGMKGLERFLKMRIAARYAALQKQIPDFADTVASVTAVGLPLAVALERTARVIPPPLGTELTLTVESIRNGANITEALRAMVRRVGSEDLKHLVEAMTEAMRSGGEGLSRTMSDQAELYRNIYLQSQKERIAGVKSKMIWILLLAAAPILVIMFSMFAGNMEGLGGF